MIKNEDKSFSLLFTAAFHYSIAFPYDFSQRQTDTFPVLQLLPLQT